MRRTRQGRGVITAVALHYQGYAALSLGVLYEDTIRYVADENTIRDWLWP